jgi:hypothetical protein
VPSKEWEKKLLILVADLMRDIDRSGADAFQARFNADPDGIMDDYAVPEAGRELLYRSAEDLQPKRHRGALAWTMGRVASTLCDEAKLRRCTPNPSAPGDRNLIDLIADMLDQPSWIDSYNANGGADVVLNGKGVNGDAREALAAVTDENRRKLVGLRVESEVLDYTFESAPEPPWPKQASKPCSPEEELPDFPETPEFWSDPGSCVRDVHVLSNNGTTIPPVAPNTSRVKLEVLGEGFRENATCSLRNLSQAGLIRGDSIVVSGSFRRSKLTTEVDLTDAQPGCYEVVVENNGLALPSGVYFQISAAQD